MKDNTSFSKSRRTLLKSAAILGAGTASASLPISASAKAKENSVNFSKSYDVIIIGSGFGGNSAAMTAAELGLKALVIEKMPAFGGNSSLNGGGMAVAGLLEQKAAGISDSVEYMKEDILAAGRGLAIPEIAETIAKNSLETYNWVVKHGANFMDGVYHYGGHRVPRIRVGARSTGADINVPLRESAHKAGTEYRANCELLDLVKENGRVVGVKVMDKAQWDRPGTGQVAYFEAKKAVVLTTGGYAADMQFRMLQDERLDANYETTNQPGGSADGIKAMMRAGGAPRHLSWIQLGPWCSPDEPGYGNSPDYLPYAQYVHGIAVDVASGKRFMNELADRRTRANAIIESARKGNAELDYPVALCDSTGHNDPGISATRRKRIVHDGTVKAFDTLDELADHYGIPGDALKQQVKDYNDYVRKGIDPQFKKPIPKHIGLKPIEKAPFYAMRIWNKIHYTMGGIAINGQGEVLSLDTSKPIPGLFAAGEVAAGAAGASRLGGCGTTDPLVMGRVAVKRVKELG